MRFAVPLLLIASIALPSIADAKAARPRATKATRAVRAPRAVVGASSLAAGPAGVALWAIPASGGLMAVAITAAGGGGSDRAASPQGAPITPPITAPTVSPE